jgi:hypothetical protein
LGNILSPKKKKKNPPFDHQLRPRHGAVFIPTRKRKKPGNWRSKKKKFFFPSTRSRNPSLVTKKEKSKFDQRNV